MSGSSDSTNAPLGSKSRKLRAWFNPFWQRADCCRSKLRKRSTEFSSRVAIQRQLRFPFLAAVVHAGCLSCPSCLGLASGVIPALGACARQFQPAGFRSPSQIGGFAFCRNTNNPLLTLRKQASLAWRAAPFAPGRPNQSGHERKTNTCFAKIASLSLVFSARTPRPDPHRTAPPILACRSRLA